MGSQREHKSRDVMQYVWDNADKPITLEEVAEKLKWTSSSVSSVLSGMVKDYPDQMVRVRRGVFIWHSEKRDVEPVEVTEMLVTIVKRREDGQLLVQDTATNSLYTMRELDW